MTAGAATIDSPGMTRRRLVLPGTPLLLVLPGMAVFFLLFVVPQAGLLQLSFEPARGSTAAAPTLEQYGLFLGDAHYLEILGRTLVLGVEVTLVTLVLGYPLAFWLARIETRWKTLLLLVTIFPLLTSAVVRSFGWMVLLYRTGPVSGVLRALGVPGPVELMYSMPGVVIAMSEVLLPFMVLTLYGVIRSIDPNLEEAAMSLGDGPLGTLRHVTLPLSLGGILGGSLLVFSLTMSSFVTPSLVGGARVQLMATTVYDQTITLANWPFASALSVVLLAVILALALLYSRALRGAQAGARD
jgi:ABC-type spermidine/putrescine transport system permease subunit I